MLHVFLVHEIYYIYNVFHLLFKMYIYIYVLIC